MMISLKGPKNPIQPSRAKVRPIRPNKRISQRRPKVRRSERKRRKRNTPDNETDKANRETVAPLQLKLMPLQPQLQVVMARRRRKLEMFLRSLTIVATKRATIPPIVLSQKISYSLSELHVGNY